jgi:hypothetical protein
MRVGSREDAISDPREANVPVYDAPGYATHEVLNRAGVLADYNAYTDDKPLVDAMKVFGADLTCP